MDMVTAQASYTRNAERIRRFATVAARRAGLLRTDQDFVAEVMALSWVSWLAVIRRGENPEDCFSAILTFACRQRKHGRRFVGFRAVRDVLSDAARMERGRVKVYVDEEQSVSLASPQRGGRTYSQADPAAVAQANLDWEAFIDSLGQLDRDILNHALEGRGCRETARVMGGCAKHVSYKRRLLAGKWKARQGI